MSSRVYRLLQSLLLVALGIFLIEKALSGKLVWYINERFTPLTFVGITLLGLMALALLLRARKKADAHEHIHATPANLLILLVPILVGILLPSRPLDATAVASKGVTFNAPLVSSNDAGQLFEMASDERNIVDWIRIFSSGNDFTPYLGEQANVIGFVYHEENLPENQFLISRFVITCCAADGFAMGIPVEWSEESFEENTWVKVKGPIQVTEWHNQKTPLILAESVEIIDAPEQPYLIP